MQITTWIIVHRLILHKVLKLKKTWTVEEGETLTLANRASEKRCTSPLPVSKNIVLYSSHIGIIAIIVPKFRNCLKICTYIEKGDFHNKHSLVHEPLSNISNTSELLQDLEELFSRYYMGSPAINIFKYTTTHWRVTRREWVT